jgi:hypothetical protein
MTIPSSGPLTLIDIQTEFGGSPATNLTEYYAGGAYVAAGTSGTYGYVPSSGEISIRNFYGTSAASPAWTGIIATNQTNLDLYTWAISEGFPGSGQATITVAPGVYVYSTSTSNAGLTIPSSFGAGNLTFVNNGYIVGQGGAGGGGDSGPGQNGGAAISILTPVTLTNNSYVAGGGGGGAGAPSPFIAYGGGGAGGGSGALVGINGGAGGYLGSAGSNGSGPAVVGGGGGGGTQFPGTGGAGKSTAADVAQGGGAGGGGGFSILNRPAPLGGNLRYGGGGGGGYGAPGGYALGGLVQTNGASFGGGTGGTDNAAGGNSPADYTAAVFTTVGAGGNSIILNGNTVTYITMGTLWGSVS